jgi:DNA-binding MarR family transcriptional regulator
MTANAPVIAGMDTGEPGLVARVVRLNLLMNEALEGIAAKSGLSLADYLVLGVVRRSPGGRTTPTRICDVLHRTTGGMTLTLDRLEAAGWLTRAADPSDRRRVVVELTDAGRQLAIAVNDNLHGWEDRHALSSRARDQIYAQLDALLALFDD